MSKFKVGDRVRFDSDERANCYPPKGTMGTVIVDDLSASPKIRWDGDTLPCYNNETYVHCDRWSVIPGNKIIITHDGKTTLARMFEGNKVIKSAEAKCAPGDTFDFSVGANLAYDRLMRPNQAAKPAADKPSPEPIKLYCVANKDEGYLTKGQVYEFTDGDIRLDNGDFEPGLFDNYADFATHNTDLAAKLVPLVSRPAKVGEWVYITEGKAKGVIGEVLHIDHAGVPLVRHRDVWGMFADQNGMELTRFSISQYLVLDGYHPEPECCRCCGQPLKKESAR